MAKPSKKVTVLAIESDQHCGSTVAVCPPMIALDDGGSYVASKLQQWLWHSRQAFWRRVGEVRESFGSDAQLIEVFNGDMTDGDHHGTTQIVSGNPTAQAAVVNECMRAPLMLDPDGLLFIRGTEAHVGKSACFEERVALGLKKDKRPVILDDVNGTASHWHAKLEIDGLHFDFAHHANLGTRPWTRANAALANATAIFYEHAKQGIQHPHIAVRSHMHQYVDTGNLQPVRVIHTPAWQMATAFVHRIDTTGKLPDIGGLIIVVRDGKADVEPVLFRPAATPTLRL